MGDPMQGEALGDTQTALRQSLAPVITADQVSAPFLDWRPGWRMPTRMARGPCSGMRWIIFIASKISGWAVSSTMAQACSRPCWRASPLSSGSSYLSAELEAQRAQWPYFLHLRRSPPHARDLSIGAFALSVGWRVYASLFVCVVAQLGGHRLGLSRECSDESPPRVPKNMFPQRFGLERCPSPPPPPANRFRTPKTTAHRENICPTI